MSMGIELDGSFQLGVLAEIAYQILGRSSEFSDKEVLPMEQFLSNVLAAIVAGLAVALILRWFR